MSRMLSNVCVALFAVSTLSMSVAGASADDRVLSVDDYRARVVDYCLYDQWKRAKNGETKGILGDCRCAAKAYVKSLSKEELTEARSDSDLSRAQKKIVLTNYAKCSK
ncbi:MULTISPECIES: hypothetical protein [Cohaesibacter]|uniref:hypothetical protein n=1 Tax=Cohaesibacter TaxID=655352 RepID=UPI0010FEAFBE|nr:MULTISPECIES: hypothetical protein [Cohaesibacter]TLP48932.1 hypothetical protein FDK21_04600 [Cohaesibacter sp. CAU 1516]